MKIRFLVSMLLVCLCLVGVASAEGIDELHFDRFYITLPEMNIREAPDKPEAVDTLHSGDEVQLLSTDDIWATFTYVKDGETRTGCTWAGAVSPAVRIHLLEEQN